MLIAKMLLSEFLMLLIWKFSLRHQEEVEDKWIINLLKRDRGCHDPSFLWFPGK